MKWTAALALVAGIAFAAAQPAWAEPMKVNPGPGWEELPGATKNEIDLLRQGDPIRGSDYGARSYTHPKRAQLLIAWVSAAEPKEGEAPPALIRRAFDEVRARRVAASPTAGSTAEISFEEEVEGDVAELRLVWRHLSNEIRYRVRAVAWVNREGKVQLAKGECIFAEGNDEAESRCEEALASIEPAAPAGKRGELGELPEAGPAPEAEPEAPPAAALLEGDAGAAAASAGEGGEEESEDSGGGPPSLEPPPEGLGEDGKLYEGSPEESGGDKSKYLVIIGGVLVVVAFYLTTRRRGRNEEGEDEHENEDEDEDDEGEDEEEDEGEEEEEDEDEDEDEDGEEEK